MEKILSVSFFTRLYKVENEVMTFEEIIILIIKRRWAKEIMGYRAALAAGKGEAARSLKNRLPGFTPSGVFRGGHKASQLVDYSRLVGLDFDDVPDLTKMKAVFREIPTTYAYFVSPGGGGLKVFVRVDCDAARHREVYPLVAATYEQASGCVSDAKCKDVSRCCYVSDDAEGYYNPDATVFAVPTPREQVMPEVEAFVRIYLQHHPAVEGNRNQTVYRLGCAANRRGFLLSDISRSCGTLLQGENFTMAEIEQALRSAYQGNSSEHGAALDANGQKRPKEAPATIPEMAPSEKEPDREEGERLREQAPYLPDEVLEGLPPLLKEVIGFYPQRRERDMALLAACTVLSACLPGVTGVYSRKRVYPHLYTVCVAPAANGKGCITDMRRLADRYASLIEAETERAEREYLQALEEWEQKKMEAHRKNQPIQVADAPQRASTAYLYIPTQITKAKLLVHLRDNGEIGGLMTDSEIDTLVVAGKMDYGMFDDLLRKAFHHEPVASSRKTDNELIRIARPRLAILLAGTPGQYPRLIPDAGSGLHSRLLLYTCRSEAVWQDVSPQGVGQDLEERLGILSEQVLEIVTELRKHPLQVCLTVAQWGELNLLFTRLLHEADLFGDEEFLGAVKRYGLMAFRLCMVFTALRCGVSGYGLEQQYCSDEHFRAALSIAKTCLEHSRLLFTQVRRNDGDLAELKFPLRNLRLLEALPEDFTLSEAYALGAAEGMSERATRRFLVKVTPQYINKIGRGEYRKVQPTEGPIV